MTIECQGARFPVISYSHTLESTNPFDRDQACKARAGKSKEEELDMNNMMLVIFCRLERASGCYFLSKELDFYAFYCYAGGRTCIRQSPERIAAHQLYSMGKGVLRLSVKKNVTPKREILSKSTLTEGHSQPGNY